MKSALPDKTGVHFSRSRIQARMVVDSPNKKAKTAELVDMQDGHESLSSESDSVSDDDDSDPTRSSHTSSSDESEPEEITQEYLNSLLEKARRDAREEDRRAKMLQEDVPHEQDVIKLEAEKEEPCVFTSVVAGYC